MALDPKLMALARAALNERRESRDREYSRREGEVFVKLPRVRELRREIEQTMRELFALALLSGTGEREIDDIRRRNLAAQELLQHELVMSGYPGDYLDDAPFCTKCSDSGFIGNKLCSCLGALYEVQQAKALSSLYKLGQESFETFQLEYYDDEPPPARAIMEGVFKACQSYARNFGPASPNLFMSGAPGLGKTFLSASIARVVAERGYSVVYDTFSSIFAKLEDEKFMRSDNLSAVREQIRRYRECDLLIADDLGTEFTTSFTVSALYELVNTRLITKKKTIVSSNLTPDELFARYSPQIASRLSGEYTVLRFYGSDIRLKKRGFD